MSTMERIIFVGKSGVAGASVSLVLIAALTFFFAPSIFFVESTALVGATVGAIIGLTVDT